jgi:RNA polymerase-binding transcription factor
VTAVKKAPAKVGRGAATKASTKASTRGATGAAAKGAKASTKATTKAAPVKATGSRVNNARATATSTTRAAKTPAKSTKAAGRPTKSTKTAPATKATKVAATGKRATAKTATKAPAKTATKKAPSTAKTAAKKTPAGPYASDAKFLGEQKALLAEERSVYEGQAHDLRAEADSLALEREPGDVQFDEESGEGGTVTVDRERNLALSAQAGLAVEEIDDAVRKIVRKTYGACERCLQPIPKARLRALPYARLCVACKSGGLSRR